MTGWMAGVRFLTRVWDFSLLRAFSPALRANQPPIQCVPGYLTPRVKLQGREADHLPPSSAAVKNRECLHSPFVFMTWCFLPLLIMNRCLTRIICIQSIPIDIGERLLDYWTISSCIILMYRSGTWTSVIAASSHIPPDCCLLLEMRPLTCGIYIPSNY
jgi:hypothetical protein